MKIFHVGCDAMPAMPPNVACIGNFDGVHKGHQALVSAACQQGQAEGVASAAIIFNPDPRTSYMPIESIFYLTTVRQRLALFEQQGLAMAMIIEFDECMRDMEPDDFVTGILGRMNIRQLICGFDFSFGRGGHGHYEDLIGIGGQYFRTLKIPQVSYDQAKISTTRICDCLAEGRLDLATAMMGHPWQWQGRLEKGWLTPAIRYARLPDGMYTVNYAGCLMDAVLSQGRLHIEAPDDPEAVLTFVVGR